MFQREAGDAGAQNRKVSEVVKLHPRERWVLRAAEENSNTGRAYDIQGPIRVDGVNVAAVLVLDRPASAGGRVTRDRQSSRASGIVENDAGSGTIRSISRGDFLEGEAARSNRSVGDVECRSCC